MPITKVLILFVGFIFPFQDVPSEQTTSTRVTLEIRLAEYERSVGLIETNSVGPQQKIYLHKEALVTNKDVIEASVVRFQAAKEISEAMRSLGVKDVRDVGDTYEIKVGFTKEAGDRMAKATENHMGKPLALLIDGKVISAPIVSGTIRDRASLIGGGGLGFTKDEAQRIANALNMK
ncbi:MAG TPA: hypothetical protein VFF31_26010 [Blastocatellia bacterium]|nr:hypothetical protein [Blastocatellia bacterium]